MKILPDDIKLTPMMLEMGTFPRLHITILQFPFLALFPGNYRSYTQKLNFSAKHLALYHLSVFTGKCVSLASFTIAAKPSGPTLHDVKDSFSGGMLEFMMTYVKAVQSAGLRVSLTRMMHPLEE